MKRFLIHNLGLKILSVIVAAIIWLIIINITDPIVSQTFDEIPVRIINDETFTSKGYQYNIKSNDKIDVEVRGKRSIVSNMSKSGFIALADLNQLSAKSTLYMAQLTVTYPGLDPDENIEITPKADMLAIELEESETVPFNVKIIQNGEVKEGYYVMSTSLSTNVLQVTASKTQVNNIKEIVVGVDVDRKSDSFEIEVNPIAIDLDGNPIDNMKLSFSQEQIGVSVVIYPVKTIGLEVVTRGLPEYGYEVSRVEFAPNSITIAGNKEDLGRIGRLIVPYDVSGHSESIDSTISINEALKELYGDKYILVDDTQNAGVIVTIDALDSKTLYILERDISISNLPDNMECTFTILPIVMKVMGKKDDIASLTVDDLAPYITLNNFEAGTQDVDVHTRNIPNVNVKVGSTSIILSEKFEEASTFE